MGSRISRILAAVLGSAVVWVAGAMPASAQQGGPPPVTVAKPVQRELVEIDEFVGRFEAVDEVSIRARVGGYLAAVHFEDGRLVTKGDLLFTIDKRPFEAALEQARSQLDVATTLVDFTRAQFTRAETLSKSGNIPLSTLDDRRREFLSAQAQFAGAEAAVRASALNLEFTEIRAPISGRIDRRLISVGNLVQADQTELTSIVALDPIDFYFDVDEREFLAYSRDARQRNASLQEGAGGLDVTVTLSDSREPPVTGKLNFAENRMDQATGSMRLRARFANPELILQPGLFGRAALPGSLPYKGILIPDEAVGADQDRRIVFTVDEAGLVSAKPVRLGPRLYGYRVVREGLTGDETIVVNGLVRVRPGVTVTPQMTELPPERSPLEAVQ